MSYTIGTTIRIIGINENLLELLFNRRLLYIGLYIIIFIYYLYIFFSYYIYFFITLDFLSDENVVSIVFRRFIIIH